MEPLAGSSILTIFILFGISLICCAIFSFLETSITALRLFKLKELEQAGGRYRSLLESLEKTPTRLLNTILIANNLCEVTAATFGTMAMDRLFISLPATISFSIGIFLTTTILLIFGEIIPKNIAKARGEKLFESTLWITNIFFYALFPFVTIIERLADTILSWFGATTSEAEFMTSEKEIRFLIDYIYEKGLMEPEKTSMLKSIFELGTTPVREIMVPSTAIVAIDAETTLNEVLALVGKYQFTRFPVYEKTHDNIIGMLHLKDLFGMIAKKEERPLKDIVRPILFIPETIKVNQLLREFKQQHMHIAMVIDEFGAIVGLVTLEDVLEEIVGEIRDEYEAVKEKVIPLKAGGWLVDASIELDQLSLLLNISFEREEALTLAGFLTEKLQHLPKKGERLTYRNYIFQVQQASPKRVFQVLIFENKPVEPTGIDA